MAMKILALDGLNDSKLCKLMNSLLQTVPGVDYANIDYLSQKLTLQLSGRDTARTITKVTQMIKENMPGVSIKLTEVSDLLDPPQASQMQAQASVPESGSKSKSKSKSKQKHAESGMHLDLAKALTTLMKEDDVRSADKTQSKDKEDAGKAEEEEEAAEEEEYEDDTDEADESDETTIEEDIAEYNRESLLDGEDEETDGLEEDVEENDGEEESEGEEEGNSEEDDTTDGTDEKISYFQLLFSKLSRETIIQIFGVFGAFVAFAISLIFEQSSIASYVFSIISLITLSVFAFLADPGKYRATSFISALLTVAASSALFFSGGRLMAILSLILYHLAFFIVLFLYDKFSRNVNNLISLNPKTLLKYNEGTVTEAPFDEVWSGDEIVMRKGDTIPFDAIVTNGSGFVDDSLMTGKTTPTEVKEGGYLYCGSVVEKAVNMRIAMVGLQENSIASVISTTIAGDEPKNTSLSQSAHRFTVMFILVALMIVLGTVMFLITSGNIDKCVYFLPVALLLLSPVGVSSAVEAIQKSALVKSVRQGIIVVSSHVLEELSAVKTVATGFGGVLTKNALKVVEVIPAEEVDEEDLVRAAAYAEFKTEHPISTAITEYYVDKYKKQIVSSHVAFCEVSSFGVQAMAEARIIGVGSERYMNENKVLVPENETGKFCVYVSKYGEYMGTIVLQDEKREGAQKLGKGLKYLGILKVVMLTGRDGEFAEAVGKKCGYDAVYSDKDAKNKANSLLYEVSISESPNEVVFAGNTDDAEAVASVCPSIAMGENALSSMFYAAKAIIPSGEPSKLIAFLRICKETRLLSWTCVYGFMAIKLALLAVAMFGGLPFIAAAAVNTVLMIGESLCAYFNSRI